MTEPHPKSLPDARHRGPPLAAVAGIHVVLFVASLVVATALAGGAHFPSPFQPPLLSKAYFAEQAQAVGVGAFLQFGAAVPLGIFTGSIVSRLRFLGVEVAGVFIALFGGFAAALLLASSALVQWVLSQPAASVNDDVVRALHLLAFALGGRATWCRWGFSSPASRSPAGFTG
ncbi:hypothetical protein [Vulgatibacter incomptus]|uniref:Uncharacterized protein n=1 Tax=Vulgatibacter incomptus TaxID=1391653 RepID=A0A0K1PHZ6_9BACT|nr:hypothetical protein [Vulgatibacter incomptus]AKU92714.1 hypothetical protein AKJ08_3101 [Vulgatibacter incomptus]